MRKALLFFVCLIIAGIIAFYAGYYFYQSNRSQVEIEEQSVLRQGVRSDSEPQKKSYYLLKIEGNQLIVYQMPEKVIYDSIKVDSLILQEKDMPALLEGKECMALTEVFEFLESCMS